MERGVKSVPAPTLICRICQLNFTGKQRRAQEEGQGAGGFDTFTWYIGDVQDQIVESQELSYLVVGKGSKRATEIAATGLVSGDPSFRLSTLGISFTKDAIVGKLDEHWHRDGVSGTLVHLQRTMTGDRKSVV